MLTSSRRACAPAFKEPPMQTPSPGRPRRVRRYPLSRRQWLQALGVALGVAALPVARHVIRRRRKGEPGPTGWFGHC